VSFPGSNCLERPRHCARVKGDPCAGPTSSLRNDGRECWPASRRLWARARPPSLAALNLDAARARLTRGLRHPDFQNAVSVRR
jgi:hypothetical protein